MMGVAHAQSRRRWSRGEEIANSISHGIGLLAALIAVPLLLAEAARRGDARSVRGPQYSASQSFLFIWRPRSSTPYRMAGQSALRGPRQLRRVPPHRWHIYSPHSRSTARPVGVVPLHARLDPGSGRSGSDGGGRPALPRHIRRSLSWHGMAVSHRSGSDRSNHATSRPTADFGWRTRIYGRLAFWAARRLPYHHLVWHLFVLVGTGCHFLAILWYAI